MTKQVGHSIENDLSHCVDSKNTELQRFIMIVHAGRAVGAWYPQLLMQLLDGLTNCRRGKRVQKCIDTVSRVRRREAKGDTWSHWKIDKDVGSLRFHC